MNEALNSLEPYSLSIADLKAGFPCLAEDDGVYSFISKDLQEKIQGQRRRDPNGYDDALHHAELQLVEMFQKHKEVAIQSLEGKKGSWNVLESKYEVCFETSA